MFEIVASEECKAGETQYLSFGLLPFWGILNNYNVGKDLGNPNEKQQRNSTSPKTRNKCFNADVTKDTTNNNKGT